MSERFLSVGEVAKLLGIDHSAISQYKMPEPDAYIGRARGWRQTTIDKWNASRPGKGNWSSKNRQAS